MVDFLWMISGKTSVRAILAAKASPMTEDVQGPEVPEDETEAPSSTTSRSSRDVLLFYEEAEASGYWGVD